MINLDAKLPPKDYLEINIPFQGFYNSIHDYEFDQELEQSTDHYVEEYGMTEEQASDYCMGFSLTDEVQNEYCEEYVSALSDELELEHDLMFDECTSPKFYNFSTDRIFAYIHKDEVLKIYKGTDKNTLSAIIKKRFTSYDGFRSHYTPCVDQWNSDILNWDANELCTLLMAFIADNLDDDYEWHLMENSKGNGFINELIDLGMDKEQTKILNKLYDDSQKKLENNLKDIF